MQKRNWRSIYTHNFPKLKTMCTVLEERLEAEMSDVLEHLKANFMEPEACFTPHFMTLFVYLVPIEIATRLFEIFILDGDNALIRVLLRMMDLKQVDILRRKETELQRYILSGMVEECVTEYSMAYLLEII